MALRVSQRAMEVARARSEAQLFLLDFAEERGLTNIELLQMLVDLQLGILKDMRRLEAADDT